MTLRGGQQHMAAGFAVCEPKVLKTKSRRGNKTYFEPKSKAA